MTIRNKPATLGSPVSGGGVVVVPKTTSPAASASASARGKLSIPLLEGFLSKPGASDGCFQDALHRFAAGSKIARFVQMNKAAKTTTSNNNNGPKITKRRSNSSNNTVAISSSSSSSSTSHHWLIQGLQSPSLVERKAAWRILCQGCPVHDKYILWQLLELISLLLPTSTTTTLDVVVVVDDDATSRLALGQHIFTHLLDSKERLALLHHPRLGLTKICQWLWKEAVSASSSSAKAQKENTTTTSCTILASLVHFIHELVFYSVTEEDAPSLHYLWFRESTTTATAATTTSTCISPLACLVGTYHLCKTCPILKASIHESTLVLLKHLVDPAHVPTSSTTNSSKSTTSATTPTTTNNTTTATTTTKKTTVWTSKDRLLDTFLHHSTNTTTTNAESAFKNSSKSPATTTAPARSSSTNFQFQVRRRNEDRSAAATVARIFNAVYGNQNDDDDEEDDDDDHDDDEDDDEEGEEHYEGDRHEEEDHDDENKKSAGENDNEDEDEEIDSEEGENDEDEDDEGEEDDDDEDDEEDDDDEDDDDEGEEEEEEEEEEDEIIVHGDDAAAAAAVLEEGLLEFDDMDVDDPTGAAAAIPAALARRSSSTNSTNSGPASAAKTPSPRILKQRRQAYIQASMEILKLQYPAMKFLHHHSVGGSGPSNTNQPSAAMLQQHQMMLMKNLPKKQDILTISAEQTLMSSVVNIVQPPKKPLNTKIILRRAPTQEEFFRGSLSKNPVSLSMLKSHENKNEPTVKDLRQHIANDLQMADSAELLELLCAKKILDIDLKLRVVHQVVWKEHLLQHSSGNNNNNNNNSSAAAFSSFLGGGGAVRGAAGGGGRSFIASGSGLSMLFGSGMERSIMGMGRAGGGDGMSSSGFNITANTSLSALPPMIITYRLTGVDGEATEDTVSKLQDPEAPSETASPEEVEQLMEQKFGVTRLVTKGRGVFCLLRSIERNIKDTLLRIRRDDVVGNITSFTDETKRGKNPKNASRLKFKQSSPYPGVELLWNCSKLPSNRKLLLQSRAPTILLRLLLDVLHALEDDGSDAGSSTSESNSTAKTLQKLIEVLASDMVSSTSDTAGNDIHEDEDIEQDASTLRLLMTAIETSSLSRPLRNVIAKLLPYLTYGQPSLCKELAHEFARNVSMDRLGDGETNFEETKEEKGRSILQATFVHASISLPANPVCDSLRLQLIECGFVRRVAEFLLILFPKEPPSWSPSLWPRGQTPSDEQKAKVEGQWKEYIARPGLNTAFDILIGLCKNHAPTQIYLGSLETENPHLSLLRACHWIESTSDSARISMNGMGLVAETLLDELASERTTVGPQIRAIRRTTRDRKKEIAMERRNKTLISMSAFGPLAGAGLADKSPNKTAVRGKAATLLGPVLGLFGSTDSNIAEEEESSGPPTKRRKKEKLASEASPPAKPAWMMEMENMEDETGLTCAVCQEGRTLQPSELLGLYAYVKKVSIPMNQCGARNSIDGTELLVSLPTSVPDSIATSQAAMQWFPSGKEAGEDLRDSYRSTALSSSIASSRRSTYTTTVSAGNAIHFSCHTKARQADRNHPKAPKSEWEGASLRNSRVNCNVILPLVSSRSSKVPLVAVDGALTDHQTAVSNLLNARPKSMLWTVLHDVRFLLLRMAYGEQLNADCGGGSMLSNAELVFYQLLMADMFEKDAQVDAPQTARHVNSLSAGFLAASAIIRADDFDKRKQTALKRGIADSSLMAALTCILCHNTTDDYGLTPKTEEKPHEQRRWVIGREYFLRGLINCAGRRHALGVENSGCITNRNTTKRGRSTSFADWDIVDEEDAMDTDIALNTSDRRRSSSSRAGIEDFKDALRPMIVFYSMMDQLSSDFVLHMDDVKVEDCANRLVNVIKECHGAKSITELLRIAKITMDHEDIMDELQRGMLSA